MTFITADLNEIFNIYIYIYTHVYIKVEIFFIYYFLPNRLDRLVVSKLLHRVDMGVK